MSTAVSRREFLTRAAIAASAAAAWRGGAGAAFGAEKSRPPITVFSKIYQELKLDFEQAAALTADAGLDGIDCPVRPGGEILPERAADEMPRYAEALRKRKVDMLLLTTGILGVSSPHAEAILRAGKKLGIRYYRLGARNHKPGKAKETTIAEAKAELKDLAALNKELGVCGVFQNHSGASFVGGDLAELHEIVKDFEPEQIGAAFDLGHAIITHGDEWPTHFEKLRSHVKVAYVKDVSRAKQFVPFGEGEFGKSDWFKRLKQMNYAAPFSLHIEFNYAGKGNPKTRDALLQALRNSAGVLRRWVAEAWGEV